MRDDLSGLRALLCVAEKRGFRSAAAELRVTPSAVSQSVRALEERVGRDSDAGADHPAEILSLRRYAIERGRRSEVDDHAWAAVFFEGSDRVNNAIGADFGGIVVVHGHPSFHSRLDVQRAQIEIALTHLSQHRIQRRHNRRNHDPVNAFRLEASH